MNHLNKLSKPNGLLYSVLSQNGLSSNLIKTNIRQISYTTKNINNNYTNNTSKNSININNTTLFNNIINNQKQLIREFRGNKRIKQNFYAQSTGSIFNDDVLPGFLTILSSPLKWIEYGKFIYRNITSNALIKSKLKALDKSYVYSKRGFFEEAEKMFKELNESIAKYDKNGINDISTIQFAAVVIKNTGLNDIDTKNYKTAWTGNIASKKLIWSRAGQVRVSQKDSFFFAQNCIEITGTQSIVVKDKNDKVISSIENQPFKSQYIFERNLSALPSQWRIASSTENPIK
ncbi:hypothetical protein RB653_000294 [Dictyostelium firmibasis]|uniref:Tim44-like domain-containing protein n=1 Tax=Dictyostelium firmibasis TaxID=79012 RepID=A0AAN7YQK0_9MYCE